TLRFREGRGFGFGRGGLPARAGRRPVTVPAEAAPVTAKTLDGLVVLDRLTDGRGLPELGEQLLSGLCAAIGAAGGAIIVDAADGQGRRTVAGYGSPVPAIGGGRGPPPPGPPPRRGAVVTKPAARGGAALVDPAPGGAGLT